MKLTRIKTVEKNKKRWWPIFLFGFLLVFLFFGPQLAHKATVWSVANLQHAKITLSDSRPGNTYTQHTYYFQTTTAIPASGKIVIDLDASGSTPFDVGTAHGYADMTLKWSPNSDMSSSTTCPLADAAGAGVTGVSVSDAENTITFTLASSGTCAGIGTTAYIEATVGDGASGGLDDIANPAKSAAAGTADTYLISYETQDDSGSTLDTATVRAAIIDAVTITAEVQATLSCSISGVTSGTNFNISPGGNTYGTAGFATEATSIPFGILNSGSSSQSGQLIKVSTNGGEGFYVAVKQYGDLTSSTGDTINAFDDGVQQDNSSPAAWSSPAGTAGSPDTYGHLGYGVTDLSLDDLNGAGASDRFTGAKFAGLSTTYEAVLSHDGPANGTGADTNGQGYVIYRVEISGLQEAGIYSNTISYLCTGRY